MDVKNYESQERKNDVNLHNWMMADDHSAHVICQNRDRGIEATDQCGFVRWGKTGHQIFVEILWELKHIFKLWDREDAGHKIKHQLWLFSEPLVVLLLE